MAETVRTRHTISGAIEKNTPVHLLEHPTLGKYLEVVDDDAKPYHPELHKPREVSEQEVTEPQAEASKADAPLKKNSKD